MKKLGIRRFNKFTSQRCNTRMLRSSHKQMPLSLTIISCVAATTHKFVTICELNLVLTTSLKLNKLETLLLDWYTTFNEQ